jgi:hypothetical protein
LYFSILYKTIASRAKKLASEDIATFAFRKANSALRDLQLKETTEEEALIKFQQANSVINLAEVLLQRTQLKSTTELNNEQRKGLQQQLKTTEGQLRDLQRQVATDKENRRKLQQASDDQSKIPLKRPY